MIVKMDKAVASSSHDLAQRLFDKNIELENKRRKSAQARVPSDPNAWQQMRENFETIILEDHTFSEKHNIEFSLWQLHYRRIEEFRAHYNAASATDSTSRAGGAGPARSDRASKIRIQFKTFLSEATGFYHDLILKIRAKYGLPIGQFYPEPENHNMKEKDGKKFTEIKKGLISCHRCLIYLGDLARYKGLYGEGESKSRDYAAASSYYLQAASLWPASGNPHHQLAILATYSGDELMAVYRYFRSLAAENPFSTARDNLIVAFEKNRQSYGQLHVDSKASSVKEPPVRTRGRGRGKVEPVVRSKEPITETTPDVEKGTEIRQLFKAFRVRFVRLNGILFTRTSLETFEEILSQVTNSLQTLLSSGPEDDPNFGTENTENALFIVILVTILIFTVNNIKGGPNGQTYADIVQNTVLLKNALTTFYDLIGQLLKRCLQLTDPSSSFLLPGILVSMEYLACRPDVVSETDENEARFWPHCISLFNKLLSCEIADVARYDEGENGNEYQPALWEDFEIRGFLPLEPAQKFLDFSRNHSVSGDKVARVKRVLAAGKIVADRKKVRFDPNLKKFVISSETQKPQLVSESKSNGVVKVDPHAHVECEDEDDEVIVFRPNLIENRTEIPLVNRDPIENVNLQIKDSVTPQFSVPVSVQQAVGQPYQSPMWPGSRQAALTGGIKGLTLMENGHMGHMQRVAETPHANLPASFTLPIQQIMGGGGVHENYDIVPPSGPDPYIVGRNVVPSMPTASSLKGSSGRPVRHLGPPPGFGFTSMRPNKQVGVGVGHNPVNDDYSWLDGYQLQSSVKPGTQYVNDSMATSSFPFPGKQVQFEMGNNQTLQQQQQQQQQYISRLDQQGQQQQSNTTWSGNQFV